MCDKFYINIIKIVIFEKIFLLRIAENCRFLSANQPCNQAKKRREGRMILITDTFGNRDEIKVMFSAIAET